jgi:uncharacterized coiled-coil DUF342 family protein
MGRKSATGIDGAAERLRGLLADVEQSLTALTEEVEKDDSQDQSETQDQLSELHAQATALVERANELLERARELAGRVEKRNESGVEFVTAFEELASGLESAAETLNPDNWDWGDDEEEAEGG